MYESVIDRIESLERSVRRWRATAIVLGVLLLSIVTTGAMVFTVARARANQAMEAAQRAEAVARAEAQAALQAERARQGADQKKE